MPEKKRGGNKYDRIFKENFGEPAAWLIEHVLKTSSVKAVPLQTKLQRTLEKEMDILWLVEQDDPYLINVEWQTSNHPLMLARMLLYYGLGFLTYQLPVKSYVIYVGSEPLTMKNELLHPMLSFHFEIISLREMDPEVFLNSNVPEDVLLAILAGKTQGEEKREIIRKILVKLQLLLKSNLSELGRRLEQLEVLGELRGIQKLIIEEEQDMRTFADAIMEAYNIENDIRFKQGIERDKLVVVTNMIQKTDFSDDKIADIAEVSIEFVQGIRKSLG